MDWNAGSAKISSALPAWSPRAMVSTTSGAEAMTASSVNGLYPLISCAALMPPAISMIAAASVPLPAAMMRPPALESTKSTRFLFFSGTAETSLASTSSPALVSAANAFALSARPTAAPTSSIFLGMASPLGGVSTVTKGTALALRMATTSAGPDPSSDRMRSGFCDRMPSDESARI
ncbi:hypothetical protein D3C87_1498990 [compost metagenome]